MRRRRSELTASSFIRACLLCLLPSIAAAQSAEVAGALELVFPFGARSVAMGQAAVASEVGTDAVWWNPAALASQRRRELALQYLQRQNFVNVVGLTYALPRPPVGVFAASLFLVDYGTDQVTDELGDVIGQFTHRFVAGVATFGTTVAKRGRAGINYRVFQRRFDCSGDCTRVEDNSAISSGIDAGLQYRVTDSLPLTIGLAIRHLGLRFQQRDEAQADALPTRFHLGITYEPSLGKAMADARARISAEIVRSPNLTATGYRTGGELEWQQRYFIRAGYAVNVGATAGSVGIGVVSGRVQIDIARSLGAENEVLGGPPTLLTLRYRF
jgi:hypothetical protein